MVWKRHLNAEPCGNGGKRHCPRCLEGEAPLKVSISFPFTQCSVGVFFLILHRSDETIFLRFIYVFLFPKLKWSHSSQKVHSGLFGRDDHFQLENFSSLAGHSGTCV
jgi:hypothetical protein